MKHWTVILPILPVDGMALFPLILLKRKAWKSDKVLIHHESIHLRQQLEMLILPFYVFYLLHYLVNLIRYQDHDKAYLNICFEKEAFHMEKDLRYLQRRKAWSWINYL